MSGSRSDPSPGTPGPTPPQSSAEPPSQASAEPLPQASAEPQSQVPLAASPEGIAAADAISAAASVGEAATDATTPRKGPLSFLSGALTSGALAWACFGLSRRVVAYYSLHPPHYEARVAQSIATALKTLIVGMTFLATFSFAFVGLGLTLVFVRSLLRPEPRSPA